MWISKASRFLLHAEHHACSEYFNQDDTYHWNIGTNLTPSKGKKKKKKKAPPKLYAGCQGPGGEMKAEVYLFRKLCYNLH